jgi:hypothetical protein
VAFVMAVSPMPAGCATIVRTRAAPSRRWDDAYHAAIVYGAAALGAEAGGMVTVRVAPRRIYAIRAPAGHPAGR